MGYQVEYLLALTPTAARDWLSQFEGSVFEPPEPQLLPGGEFLLWDDLWLVADLGPTACSLRIPQLRYSWLIAGHRPAVAQVERFERLLAESLPGVRGVRVDEWLWSDWEAGAGPWEKLPDPVKSLRDWLVLHELAPGHYHFLPEEQDRVE